MKLIIFLIISCICLLDSVNSKSKYYDGPDRAYKFGYSIEGNQHRQEQKDENGIIMGEYGFITADGVYHVTGYGTDENGNFKILYMKNIKIGLPGDPQQEPAPKNLGGNLPAPTSAPVTSAAPPPPPPPQPQSFRTPRVLDEPRLPKPSDISSCGSCTIPELEKEKIKNLRQGQQVSSNANSIAQAPRDSSSSGLISERTSSSGIPDGLTGSGQGPATPSQGRQGKALGFDSPSNDLTPTSYNDDNTSSPSGSSSGRPSPNAGSTGSRPPTASGSRPSGSSQDSGPGSPSKIPLDLIKMQETINGLLYKFNYTVGYHGHHEQGDTIGNKDGGYFSVSRDGYHRTVDYTANENGFQPYIKLRQAEDHEIPKPETEKEAGLKGYEFKWFNLGDDKKQ